MKTQTQSTHHTKFGSIGLLIALAISGCGSGTNVNKIWGGSDEASDSILLKAKAAYDRGDFSDAESLALQVYNRNSDNEDAAVLLGYTYLSLGGIDPYSLARRLIEVTDEEEKSTTALVAATEENKEDDGAGSLLTKLATIINLSEPEKASLQEKTFQGTSDLFNSKTNPIVVPAKVTDTLRENVRVLNYMNKAIKIICRFVDDSVKVKDEPRHQDSGCERSDGPHRLPAKAHFLWAFSHLGETLVYQATLLYSSTATGGSNFEAAAKDLDKSTLTLESFSDRVADMQDAVDQVFDTDSSDSMIAATLLDIEAVNLAFDAIPGLPDNFTKRISDTLDKIKSVGKKLGSDSPTSNTKALKGQMTQKLATKVGKKIDEALDSTKYATKGDFDDLPPEKQAEIQKVCAAYDKLVIGVPTEKLSRPEKCPKNS